MEIFINKRHIGRLYDIGQPGNDDIEHAERNALPPLPIRPRPSDNVNILAPRKSAGKPQMSFSVKRNPLPLMELRRTQRRVGRLMCEKENTSIMIHKPKRASLKPLPYSTATCSRLDPDGKFGKDPRLEYLKQGYVNSQDPSWVSPGASPRRTFPGMKNDVEPLEPWEDFPLYYRSNTEETTSLLHRMREKRLPGKLRGIKADDIENYDYDNLKQNFSESEIELMKLSEKMKIDRAKRMYKIQKEKSYSSLHAPRNTPLGTPQTHGRMYKSRKGNANGDTIEEVGESFDTDSDGEVLEVGTGRVGGSKAIGKRGKKRKGKLKDGRVDVQILEVDSGLGRERILINKDGLTRSDTHFCICDTNDAHRVSSRPSDKSSGYATEQSARTGSSHNETRKQNNHRDHAVIREESFIGNEVQCPDCGLLKPPKDKHITGTSLSREITGISSRNSLMSDDIEFVRVQDEFDSGNEDDRRTRNRYRSPSPEGDTFVIPEKQPIKFAPDPFKPKNDQRSVSFKKEGGETNVNSFTGSKSTTINKKLEDINFKLDNGAYDFNTDLNIHNINLKLDNQTDDENLPLVRVKHKKIKIYKDGDREAYLRALAMAQLPKLPTEPWMLCDRISRQHSNSYFHLRKGSTSVDTPLRFRQSLGDKKINEMKHIFGKENVNDYYPGGKKNPLELRKDTPESDDGL